MAITKMKYLKRLGQNFLHNDSVVIKMLDYAENLERYNVYEVGSGSGFITQYLLESPALKVVSVEFDDRLIPVLQEKFSSHANFELHNIDALYCKEEDLIDSPSCVIANVPYNLSVSLLLKWLGKIELFQYIIVVLQKEVAEKIVAKKNTKSYGGLSIVLQCFYSITYCFEVSKDSFTPASKVDSAIIKLEVRKEPLYKIDVVSFLKVVKKLFCYKRKTLLNNLIILLKEKDLALEICESLNLDVKLRIGSLSVVEIAKLSEAILEHTDIS